MVCSIHLGVRRRTGDTASPDFGLPIEALLALQNLLEVEWNESLSLVDQVEIFLSLRGNEIMIIHLGGICEYLDSSTSHPQHPHVLITLRGRLKGDMIDQYHAVPMAVESASGLQGELWTRRFVDVREQQGGSPRIAFVCTNWKEAKATDYEPGLHERFIWLLPQIGQFLPNEEDIEEKVRFCCSFWRDSNMQAQIKNEWALLGVEVGFSNHLELFGFAVIKRESNQVSCDYWPQWDHFVRRGIEPLLSFVAMGNSCKGKQLEARSMWCRQDRQVLARTCQSCRIVVEGCNPLTIDTYWNWASCPCATSNATPLFDYQGWRQSWLNCFILGIRRSSPPPIGEQVYNVDPAQVNVRNACNGNNSLEELTFCLEQ